MGKPLVIVESPTKAKTISKFLGKDYIVESSFGHIRDLPKSKIGVDVENNFEPMYEIPDKVKKQVAKLKKLAKDAEKIILATDEDREGEAIAWHLVIALGLQKTPIERIVFHEITKSAIKEALANPRDIDDNLVDAQQARRILDRLVGYKLSPLLWKKVYRGLSAGRVQSVAVRMIVEREKEIQDFKAKEYWSIEALLRKTKEIEAFSSVLYKKDGKKLDKFTVENEEQAKNIVKSLEKATYIVEEVTKKETKRYPSPPFTTSTLQQAASSRFGYSAKQTMMIAQRLYEGVSLGSEGNIGLITYMRTDSLNLSGQAIAGIRKYIENNHSDTLPESPNFYKTKKKGAQEAHEAIRPTDIFNTPSKVKQYLDAKQFKLYDLIWRKALACQMKPAVFDSTTVDIGAVNFIFRSTGSTIKQKNFLEIYPTKVDENILPELKKGEVLDLEKLNKEQHFTQPPARFSEATLIKALEEYGIGRPSTYAPTISTIQARKYVEKKEDKRLHPTDLGIVVNDFLVKNFDDIVDYEFTAEMEQKFDDIAEGEVAWQPMIKKFYAPFASHVEELTETAERATGDRELGVDPKSGKPVIARIGRYGPMVQIGTKDDEEKPKFAKLLPSQNLSTITFKEAMELFKLPRIIGKFEDKEVMAAIGRFGPYIKHDDKFVSIPKDLDPYTIKIDEAIELIQEKRKIDAEKFIASWESGTIQILRGRYGPYIKTIDRNVKIPNDVDPEKLTLEEARELIETAPPPRRYTRKKK